MPDVARRLRDLGLAAQSSTPQQFADLIRTETEKVTRIVKDAEHQARVGLPDAFARPHVGVSARMR